MGLVDNVIHLFAPLTANCRDFRDRWDQAVHHGTDGIGGCWEGEWISAATGHRGRLRCVIDPVAPALWKMHFRGEYAKVFRACYSTDFNVTMDSGRWTFSGGSDLGALAGGRYTYTGYATLQGFVCEYRSVGDHGEFRLGRFQSPRVHTP
jgi:hypothetical protein